MAVPLSINAASTSGANASGSTLGGGTVSAGAGDFVYNAKGSGSSVTTYILAGGIVLVLLVLLKKG